MNASPIGRLLSGLIVLAICCSQSSGNQQASSANDNQWTPPTELFSRNKKYCVKMVHTKLPNANLADQFFTLVVLSKGRTLAKFPTMGYLLDAFWSPDNSYVAVNNRRANAGDYLWIISLSDGNALKMPEDLAAELGRNELGTAEGETETQTIRQVTSRCPDCTNNNLSKGWMGARGWKSPTELMVLEDFHFRELKAWIEVNKVYQVTGHKVVLTGQTIERYSDSEEESRMRLGNRTF